MNIGCTYHFKLVFLFSSDIYVYISPENTGSYGSSMSFPGGSDGKESICNSGDPGLIPRSGRSPGERNGYLFQFLPGKFQGQRSLVSYNPWGHKESDMTERLTL